MFDRQNVESSDSYGQRLELPNHLIITVSSNGLSCNQPQVITWTNFILLLIGFSGPNFNAIRRKIQTCFVQKVLFLILSAKQQPLFLGINSSHFEAYIEPQAVVPIKSTIYTLSLDHIVMIM